MNLNSAYKMGKPINYLEKIMTIAEPYLRIRK